MGFLLLVSALLLFLALATYSPLDPSMNTSAAPIPIRPAANWIGVVGALVSDVLLQAFGLAAFFLPVFVGMLGVRWFRSRKIDAAGVRMAGGTALVIFFSALLALLPWHWRWLHVIPIEGLLGRITGDALIHYFNLVGAYLVAASCIAIALYLSTAFSFGAVRLWAETRFTFLYALRDRYQDWQAARAKKKSAKELEKRRAQRPVVTTQLIQAKKQERGTGPSVDRSTGVSPVTQPSVPTGIEREFGEQQASGDRRDASATKTPPEPTLPQPDQDDVEITSRADAEKKAKTTMPKIAGGYKLPSSALLHRPDEQHAVNEEELKTLAKVLVEKCAEFDVHGQVTQINPGPVVTTFEMKPEAGVKYSRFTSLSEDLCLGLRAESILIERMAGKSTVGIQVPNRERETIWLRECIESQEFLGGKSRLTIGLGKDINGRLSVADLATMPHLLIAGSTGSGKSVAINAFIMSLLYKSNPDQVRLILV
ncbi:MAG: DNA translocase FtsK 4TM domain-containing protein, partial [Terriglobales bacterium]